MSDIEVKNSRENMGGVQVLNVGQIFIEKMGSAQKTEIIRR